MKTASKVPGIVARLSLGVAALLTGQLALAVGTDAGTAVNNTASVTYDVNTTSFTEPSTAADFVVDRRVDFSVTRMGTGLTTTGPGEDNAFVDFYVTNVSNGPLDLRLVAAQVASTTEIYPGQDDNSDTTVDSIAVSALIDPTPGTGDGPDPVYGGPTFIDELPEDQSIRVRIYADTPTTVANGDILGLELQATAADPVATTGSLGADLAESATWTSNQIDNVFAGTIVGTTATESDLDGFEVQSAQLVITKSATVVSDPINNTTNPRAIPGAIIEYLIEIDNTAGAAAADNVSIADDIDTDVVFRNGANNPYNGGASNIVFDQGLGTESYCDADDATDTNSDGCSFGGAPLSLTIEGRDDSTAPVITPISVAAGATVTVRFQVEIPN